MDMVSPSFLANPYGLSIAAWVLPACLSGPSCQIPLACELRTSYLPCGKLPRYSVPNTYGPEGEKGGCPCLWRSLIAPSVRFSLPRSFRI